MKMMSNRFSIKWLGKNALFNQLHLVHSADELRMLAEKFPNNIKLYTAEKNG